MIGNSVYNQINLFTEIEELVKIRDRKEFSLRSKRIIDLALSRNSTYIICRLAQELEYRGFKVGKLERYVIQSNDPYFILKFARDIESANIPKLQQAIIETNDILAVARFGCLIAKSDKIIIEDLIIQKKSAKAAYLYLRYAPQADIEKFKHILLNSKRPRYLFLLATLISDPKTINYIQELIIKSNSNMYCRMLARYVPGVDIAALEAKIISTNNIEEMRKFMAVVNSPKIEKLSVLF